MNAYINDSERFGAFEPIGACAVCNGGGYLIQVANGGLAVVQNRLRPPLSPLFCGIYEYLKPLKDNTIWKALR